MVRTSLSERVDDLKNEWEVVCLIYKPNEAIIRGLPDEFSHPVEVKGRTMIEAMDKVNNE